MTNKTTYGGSAAGLRFAPLVRVSTEGQKKKGESITTQTTQIERYVELLGGIIPGHCWKYSGQEHATPDQDRAKLDELLADAAGNIFDAVIVVEPTRWSRDNAKSKGGLETLRQHGIRFFVGLSEQNLNDPTHRLFLGMSVEIGEYQAGLQALKSIQSRIERAKQGRPVSGKLPFGRTFDKATGRWGIDKKLQKMIQQAANRYLAGEPMPQIAKSVGMKHVTLWNVLRKRSGPVWMQRLRSEKLNIHEEIETPVPPLLDKTIIAAIAEQAEANKTYNHGMRGKNFYLLSGMIFCNKCQYSMFGQTNKPRESAVRYYRHAHTERMRECDKSLWIRAHDIEQAVMAHVFGMMGDVKAMEEAVERAIPDLQQVEELKGELEDYEGNLARLDREMDRLVEAIVKGVISEEQARKTREDIENEVSARRERCEVIQTQLNSIPSRQVVRRKAEAIARARQAMARSRYRSDEHFDSMTDEQKRELLQVVFAGKNSEGNKLGVYVDKADNGTISYRVVGNLPEVRAGILPMCQDEQDYRLRRETDADRFYEAQQQIEIASSKVDDDSPGDGVDTRSVKSRKSSEARQDKAGTRFTDY